MYRRSSFGLVWLALALSGAAQPARALEPPPERPRYSLDIDLALDRHQATVRQRVTWINTHDRPAGELVFNAHSHYQLPDKDIGFMAKMLELLRTNPSEGLDFDGPALQVTGVALIGAVAPHRPATLQPPGPGGASAAVPVTPLTYGFRKDEQTTLEVPLPRPVRRGEAVTVEIDFTMRLPPKKGRWGQWEGVTFLSNWQPVVAVYDDGGWHPTPFIPWHQPFFNEAGSFSVRVSLPCDQKVACTGSVVQAEELGDGRRRLWIEADCARDFAFLCSARFREFVGQAGPVRVRCLALPEHEFYARDMVRIACEAIPTYAAWFGPYPYPEFTLVESYFGWNGNECAGLVMIDERIFALPHVAEDFVDYLVSHETCHQWWYNVIGTNGYCETWMDEGMATYFSHRLLTIKHGRNEKMIKMPKGLEWLPNINRDTYRYYGLYGTIGRGEAGPTVTDMPNFVHLVTLLSMTYDRGAKIVGMIEDRLGEAAFFDFMRIVYRKYYFRILRVADFQHELESYTGQPWAEFFYQWLYVGVMTDWCVEGVDVAPLDGRPVPWRNRWLRRPCGDAPCRVTVLVRQKGQYTEQTVVGFRLGGGDGYEVRIPILPMASHTHLDDPPADVEALGGGRFRVTVTLPQAPTQVAVDPDQLLVDTDPANNYWKREVRWRLTPLYTQLDETDLTEAWDRLNVTVGPWAYMASYADPWYTRSMMAGLRAGVYRTQHFNAGIYTAYRTDDRDIVAGADALVDHWPWSHTQVGFNAERSLTSFDDERVNSRGVVFGRYVFQYGDCLYLPPMQYLEEFNAVELNSLPLPRHPTPGADHFDQMTTAGLHYHQDYLTPYWDPEGGFRLDATYSTGFPIFGEHQPFNRIDAQFSAVKGLPDWLGPLSETKVAGRIYGAAGLPDNGEFYTLGGGELFRGYDLQERQGSAVWVASVEWRVPLARRLTWDVCDHVAGLRTVYAVAFYDVGDAYLKGRPLGPVAHALGGGLRVDVAWFSIVERTTLRLDVARTVNDPSAPVQVWFGIQHPF